VIMADKRERGLGRVVLADPSDVKAVARVVAEKIRLGKEHEIPRFLRDKTRSATDYALSENPSYKTRLEEHIQWCDREIDNLERVWDQINLMCLLGSASEIVKTGSGFNFIEQAMRLNNQSRQIIPDEVISYALSRNIGCAQAVTGRYGTAIHGASCGDNLISIGNNLVFHKLPKHIEELVGIFKDYDYRSTIGESRTINFFLKAGDLEGAEEKALTDTQSYFDQAFFDLAQAFTQIDEAKTHQYLGRARHMAQSHISNMDDTYNYGRRLKTLTIELQSAQIFSKLKNRESTFEALRKARELPAGQLDLAHPLILLADVETELNAEDAESHIDLALGLLNPNPTEIYYNDIGIAHLSALDAVSVLTKQGRFDDTMTLVNNAPLREQIKRRCLLVYTAAGYWREPRIRNDDLGFHYIAAIPNWYF